MLISQMQGIRDSLADLPKFVPLDTVKHYEDYVARLHQIPRAFKANARGSPPRRKDGLMPPRIPLEQISMRRHNCRKSVLGPDQKVSSFNLCRGPEAPDRRHRAGGELRGLARVSPLRRFHRQGLRTMFTRSPTAHDSRTPPSRRAAAWSPLRHKGFHVETLGGGSLPLDMFEARIENWIRNQLRNGASKTKVLDSREP